MLGQHDRPPTVLLVEEDPLLGLEVGDVLAEAGYRVAGPMRSQAEAMEWVRGSTPDLAVLDTSLRDGDGSRLARVLRARGVPFLVHAFPEHAVPVHADHARDATTCAELHAAPRLTKPAWPRDLVLVLGQLAREARP
ncbi:response regulator [Methylobacterium tarhaniae]|uniref:response regulator n=1 Tax=Methylobacterium tarhaniae TaxID=1187852 RepID=UPI003D046541